MNKKVRELLGTIQKKSTRLSEIVSAADGRETKEMTAEERREASQLESEINIAKMHLQVENNRALCDNLETRVREADLVKSVRESVESNKKTSYQLRAFTKVNTSADVTAGGFAPLTIEDFVAPLEKGLIMEKVGLPVLTGLAGDYCWPKVGYIECTVANETVDLQDSKIDFTKLTPNPQRVGLTVPLSNQSVMKSDSAILNVVRAQLPQAVVRTLNKALFSPTKVYTNLYGPICETGIFKGQFAATAPTLAEILGMKAKVFGAGVQNDGTAAYVMTEGTKAVLEATPTGAGDGRMIVENDKINGIPVFCTEFIGEGNVLFGVWSYEPVGQFGDVRFIVNPYSGDTSDTVRFTINSDWSMSCLRPEAFCYMAKKP